ncbi:ATP-binding protein [Streptomyces sp. 7N604]|uniref:ATP-binding protein n=1 Tax=Streptomyces sp. 7N604 TaxID=3457415 RepID=UPI003FD25BCD
MPTRLLGSLYQWTSCTPAPASEGRAILRRVLTEWGLPGEVISNGVLAASELVANASEHAPGPYEMRLRRTARELVCEIQDRSPRFPEVPEFPAEAPFRADPDGRGGGPRALVELLSERGRGLHIVHSLTGGAWGFRRLGEGAKVAWIALPLPHDGASRSVR